MVTPEEETQPKQEEKEEAPRLDAAFFSKLVRQPDCITKGTCNGCGRCEH